MDGMFWNSLKTLLKPDELQVFEPFLLFRWGVQIGLLISLFLSTEPWWQSSCIIFILQMPYWSFLSKIKLSWLQISVSPMTSVGAPSSLCNWTSGCHSKLNMCRPIPIFLLRVISPVWPFLSAFKGSLFQLQQSLIESTYSVPVLMLGESGPKWEKGQGTKGHEKEKTDPALVKLTTRWVGSVRHRTTNIPLYPGLRQNTKLLTYPFFLKPHLNLLSCHLRRE